MKPFNGNKPILFVLLSASLILSGCRTTDQSPAQLYDGFGDYHRPITTKSKKAQALFDQGMQLMYGFNHDEAIRSFHAAALADPTAAMPWWGIAYAHGININDPAMSDERSKLARDAADTALRLIGEATPAETLLIQAVSQRYKYPAPKNRRFLDEAYAEAMMSVYDSFPNDPEAGTLYGDALMNLQPWDYWNVDGSPKERADEIVRVLENTLAIHPEHPGANHFYIHTVEASKNPDRAIPAADRLRTLVPGAGHLVHMPSHIYIRVGRYLDAVRSNIDAVEADRRYLEKAPKPVMYAIYYAHNLHFLSYAAMMAGQYEQALKAARDLESDMPEEPLKAFAGLIEGIMPTVFHVMIRFGKWEEILPEADYAEHRLVSRAVRRYARSIALSSLGRTEEARIEMEAFDIAVSQVPKDWMIFNNSIGKVLPIARAMMEGELLWREGKVDAAFERLRFGIQEEDTLVYDEPPGWMIPARHALGALLMKNNQAEEAEKIYLQDLERNRNNGWGLIGLQQAYRAQGKTEQANELEIRIQTIWPANSARPSSSCYCEPGNAL